MVLWKIRRCQNSLLRIGHLLHQKGLVAAKDGNLSLRLDDGHILATATGVIKGMMTRKHIVMVNSEGRQIGGTCAVSSEIDMHLTIYRLRADVKAVIHAHPCVATAFASAGISLDLPLCAEVIMALGSVPLAPYGTTGTPEVSESLLPFIPNHNAILMANHGVVSYGSDLTDAYARMEAVEHFAKVMLITHQLGQRNILDDVKVTKLLKAKQRYQERVAFS